LVQFTTRFLEDLAASPVTLNSDTILGRLVADLKKALPPVQKSLEQIRSSEKTKELSLADRDRDEAYKAVETALKAYRYAKVELDQKAYLSIKHLMDQYKKSKTANYEEQTALVGALLSKLKTEPYLGQVRHLGLQRFVDNLAEANKSFNTLFSQRSQEKLTQVSYDRKKLRADLIAAYRDLYDYAHIMARIKGDKVYHDLVTVLNNSRKYYADLIAERR
jgi:hypothetical protein